MIFVALLCITVLGVVPVYLTMWWLWVIQPAGKSMRSVAVGDLYMNAPRHRLVIMLSTQTDIDGRDLLNNVVRTTPWRN